MAVAVRVVLDLSGRALSNKRKTPVPVTYTNRKNITQTLCRGATNRIIMKLFIII